MPTKNDIIFYLMVGSMFLFAFLYLVNSANAAPVSYVKGAYVARIQDNVPSRTENDKTDKQGTALNEPDDFWRRTRGQSDTVGYSTNVAISTSGWTLVPATASISADHLGWWISPLPETQGKFLINFTSNPLMLPATNQGLLMKGSTDDPFQIAITTKCSLIIIENYTFGEQLFIKELR